MTCSFAEHFLFFLHNLFTKANVLSNVIKISCSRGRNMPPPFYAARCGPARLTSAVPRVSCFQYMWALWIFTMYATDRRQTRIIA